MRPFRNQLCMAFVAILHSALPATAAKWNQALRDGGLPLTSIQKPRAGLPCDPDMLRHFGEGPIGVGFGVAVAIGTPGK